MPPIAKELRDGSLKLRRKEVHARIAEARRSDQDGSAGITIKNARDAQLLFIQRAADALDTLIAVMQDEGAPPPARVAAANSILDRGLGKPVAVHQMQISDDRKKEITSEDLINLPTDQLSKAIEVLASLEGMIQSEGDTIDVTPEED